MMALGIRCNQPKHCETDQYKKLWVVLSNGLLVGSVPTHGNGFVRQHGIVKHLKLGACVGQQEVNMLVTMGTYCELVRNRTECYLRHTLVGIEAELIYEMEFVLLTDLKEQYNPRAGAQT